jgi:thiamine-monophosphate kinase
MGEFDLIARYFLPLSQGRVEAQSFQNDGAVLKIPAGKELVVTTDMLVENTHFLSSQSAASIAQKALRTNLSDLAAMGSEPYCYQMALALPEVNEDWLEKFSAALAEDNKRYGVFLSGGDTTRSSHGIVISITAFGLVDAGKSVTRSGAKAGDRIVVSGTIGAAYCGLQRTLNKIQAEADHCIKAYESPEPPVALGSEVALYAHAALDISDGLLADLGHMAKASNLRADINLDAIPISHDVKSLIDQGLVTYEDILSGGDDYELVMAVPSENCEKFIKAAREKNIVLQDIGVFYEGDAVVRVIDNNGIILPFEKQGWQHF